MGGTARMTATTDRGMGRTVADLPGMNMTGTTARLTELIIYVTMTNTTTEATGRLILVVS